jgi:predicted regulator of Ras-like GTPase activity (Roadblock/LC7/MglB family)
MRLHRILHDLVETAPGAIAAVLADWEGESVAVYTRGGDGSDYEIKFVGAHQGILLARAREMIERLRQGEPREFTISSDRFQAITVPVNHDYYVVLTLAPGALPFRVRAAVKKAVAEIEADIA